MLESLKEIFMKDEVGIICLSSFLSGFSKSAMLIRTGR